MGKKLSLLNSLAPGFKLILLAVFLLSAISLLSSVASLRLDLTEDHLYTLSDGSKNILSSIDIDEPLHLQFFYSKQVSQGATALQTYAQRVEEMLREYELQSHGRLLLSVIDPEPFSEEEDEAALLGLQGMPTGSNDVIYFGLVGERADGKQEIITFFNPAKEAFLEYDISQLLYRLIQEKPLVVGVISSLPIFQHINMQTQQRDEPKVILEQLRQMFNVKRMYDVSIDEIDDEIDLLMLVHPHLWPQQTLYAIDQFVLRGGRLLVFMDPNAQLDQSEGSLFKGFQDRSSSLEQLLTAWGVSYDPKKILLDYDFAHSIPVSQYGQALPHLGVLGIEEEGINSDESMTADIEQINLASTGVLSPIATGDDFVPGFVPLLQSSSNAQLMAVSEYVAVSNHAELLRLFQADGNGPYTIAAYVHGAVSSAFPEGRPPTSDNNADGVNSDDDEHIDLSPHINQSQKDIAVVVFADTDILDDRMWVEVQEFFGQRVATPWAGNSDLIMNILERLSGSVDLINVRSRGTYHRPFTKVDELERVASERFREEETSLLNKLEAAEAKIMQLNNMVREVSTEIPSALPLADIKLTKEQQAEITAFEKERMLIRKNLREVQHQLNKDIESLGTRLKIINIVLMPALLVMVYFLLWLWRFRRLS